ncbi:hypothetical protein AB9F39_35550, partial [Rhizobium leguminosarum]|uniref:hypothetical protein n=1 Tax=Rhizobium leguminosarum TaxID=384 RepID=UPI003F998D18
AVPEQTGFIVDVLTATYRRDGVLPDLYIISPFKEIKNSLRQALAHAAWIDPNGNMRSSPPKLSRWLKERIGAEHHENDFFLFALEGMHGAYPFL